MITDGLWSPALQVKGSWRCQHPNLTPLHSAALAALERLGGRARCLFEHIPRAQNAAADALANRAMDERVCKTRFTR